MLPCVGPSWVRPKGHKYILGNLPLNHTCSRLPSGCKSVSELAVQAPLFAVGPALPAIPDVPANLQWPFSFSYLSAAQPFSKGYCWLSPLLSRSPLFWRLSVSSLAVPIHAADPLRALASMPTAGLRHPRVDPASLPKLISQLGCASLSLCTPVQSSRSLGVPLLGIRVELLPHQPLWRPASSTLQ